jgi:hypothetical protein
MAVLSDGGGRLPRLVQRNASTQQIGSGGPIWARRIELLRAGTFSGAACYQLTELPSFKRLPSRFGTAIPPRLFHVVGANRFRLKEKQYD